MERDYGFPAAIAGDDSHTAAMSSMGVEEAFLRGYFSDLISLQPLLQPAPLPSLNYYFPYDAGVSAQPQPVMNYHSPYDGTVSGSQFQYAPPQMSYHSLYDGGVSAVSASQFQYAPSQMSYHSPYDGSVSASQFQYAPSQMSYHSPYDGGVSASQFQYAPSQMSPYDRGVSAVSASQFQYAPPLNYPSPYDGGVSSFQLPAYGYLEQAAEIPLKIPKNESFDSQEFAFQLLNLNGGGVTPEPLINFFSTSDDAAAGKYRHRQEVKSVRSYYKPYSRPSEAGRVRRQRITEKTLRLKQLLPWDKRMDTGTMLEETYKYVKFLEAQVSILQAMPVESKAPPNPSSGEVMFSRDSRSRAMEEELRKLDRQQLLQVVVNSRATQTVLYSRGFCVYSGEQLAKVLRDLSEKKAFWEQLMLASPFRFH